MLLSAGDFSSAFTHEQDPQTASETCSATDELLLDGFALSGLLDGPANAVATAALPGWVHAQRPAMRECTATCQAVVWCEPGCGAQSAETRMMPLAGFEQLAVEDAVLDLKLDGVLGLDAV